MSDTRISVLVPCYNLGAYLDEAVDSALAQNHDNLEIIVVNDGSTDPDTNRLLSGYRRPKTRVVQSENRGPAGARNLAIAHATGDYLCALDADDKLAPGYFAKAAAILDADPSITFVSSWLQMFGEEETLWKQERCDLPALLAECTVCTAALVRKSAVDSIGGFDVDLPAFGYEDWDLWLSLVEKGFRGVVLPEVMFYYRRRPGSVSSVACHGETQLKLWKALLDKHRDSYARHIVEVLLWKDAEISDWLRGSRDLELLVDDQLAGRLARREEELARLQRKLAAPPGSGRSGAAAGRIAALDAALTEARTRLAAKAEELEAMRADLRSVLQSNSWKLTAPMRLLRHWLGGGRS
jgi:glycosyltransferase involved in cell wall biosynthesis